MQIQTGVSTDFSSIYMFPFVRQYWCTTTLLHVLDASANYYCTFIVSVLYYLIVWFIFAQHFKWRCSRKYSEKNIWMLWEKTFYVWDVHNRQVFEYFIVRNSATSVCVYLSQKRGADRPDREGVGVMASQKTRDVLQLNFCFYCKSHLLVRLYIYTNYTVIVQHATVRMSPGQHQDV